MLRKFTEPCFGVVEEAGSQRARDVKEIMGYSTSSEKEIYLMILETLINQRGKQVRRAQLVQFLLTVNDVSPWFCEEDSPGLCTWERLGRKLSKICFSAKLSKSNSRKYFKSLHCFGNVSWRIERRTNGFWKTCQKGS